MTVPAASWLAAGGGNLARCAMRILMILIPQETPAVRGGARALRLERFAGPYYVFRDSGAEIVLASPEGGAPWIKPGATEEDPPGLLARFKADRPIHDALTDTLSLDQVVPEDFSGAFCIGAPGTVWRNSDVDRVSALIGAFLSAGKPVAAVPAGIEVGPLGSDEGLVIVADGDGASVRAARALLATFEPNAGPAPR